MTFLIGLDCQYQMALASHLQSLLRETTGGDLMVGSIFTEGQLPRLEANVFVVSCDRLFAKGVAKNPEGDLMVDKAHHFT